MPQAIDIAYCESGSFNLPGTNSEYEAQFLADVQQGIAEIESGNFVSNGEAKLQAVKRRAELIAQRHS